MVRRRELGLGHCGFLIRVLNRCNRGTTGAQPRRTSFALLLDDPDERSAVVGESDERALAVSRPCE